MGSTGPPPCGTRRPVLWGARWPCPVLPLDFVVATSLGAPRGEVMYGRPVVAAPGSAGGSPATVPALPRAGARAIPASPASGERHAPHPRRSRRPDRRADPLPLGHAGRRRRAGAAGTGAVAGGVLLHAGGPRRDRRTSSRGGARRARTAPSASTAIPMWCRWATGRNGRAIPSAPRWPRAGCTAAAPPT